jgi:hypothetical protein
LNPVFALVVAALGTPALNVNPELEAVLGAAALKLNPDELAVVVDAALNGLELGAAADVSKLKPGAEAGVAVPAAWAEKLNPVLLAVDTDGCWPPNVNGDVVLSGATVRLVVQDAVLAEPPGNKM